MTRLVIVCLTYDVIVCLTYDVIVCLTYDFQEKLVHIHRLMWLESFKYQVPGIHAKMNHGRENVWCMYKWQKVVCSSVLSELLKCGAQQKRNWNHNTSSQGQCQTEADETVILTEVCDLSNSVVVNPIHICHHWELLIYCLYMCNISMSSVINAHTSLS